MSCYHFIRIFLTGSSILSNFDFHFIFICIIILDLYKLFKEMNRVLKPKLFISNQRKLLLAFSSRFSVDTGSKEHIEGLVKDKKVVVFMKGTADKPRCGFSNAVVQILNFHGVDNFDHHNVLDDESLRQGILKCLGTVYAVFSSFCPHSST